MHRRVGIVLAYLKCHAHILSMVVFNFIDGLAHSSNLLICQHLAFICCLLLVSLLRTYLITSDSSASRYVYRRRRQLTIALVDWQKREIVSGKIYPYTYITSTLYLRFCTGVYLSLPPLLVNGLNTSIFHDNIKCVTTN